MSQRKTPQQQLRGSLPQKGPGSRGIEHAARNPQCQRLTALLLAGVQPSAALKKVYGDNPQEGLSPFAFSIGNQVERAFFKNDASLLRGLYIAANRLSPGSFRIATIDPTKALTQTEELLCQKLSKNPKAPNLIIKPRFTLSIADERYEVEPDALFASDTDPFYRPIEIKSYADRGGKTDPAAIRGACRQLSVGVIALRLFVERLGVERVAMLVPAVGDLILRVPGAMKPTLREMLLRGEVYSIESFLQSLPSALDRLLLAVNSASLESASMLDAIPNRYRSDCREFCALAARCKQQAFSCQSLAVLGETAKESLAAAGDLGRVIALLRPEATTNPEEEALAQKLREAASALKKACPQL